jgi:hypothetical protein
MAAGGTSQNAGISPLAPPNPIRDREDNKSPSMSPPIPVGMPEETAGEIFDIILTATDFDEALRKTLIDVAGEAGGWSRELVEMVSERMAETFINGKMMGPALKTAYLHRYEEAKTTAGIDQEEVAFFAAIALAILAEISPEAKAATKVNSTNLLKVWLSSAVCLTAN